MFPVLVHGWKIELWAFPRTLFFFYLLWVCIRNLKKRVHLFRDIRRHEGIKACPDPMSMSTKMPSSGQSGFDGTIDVPAPVWVFSWSCGFKSVNKVVFFIYMLVLLTLVWCSVGPALKKHFTFVFIQYNHNDQFFTNIIDICFFTIIGTFYWWFYMHIYMQI